MCEASNFPHQCVSLGYWLGLMSVQIAYEKCMGTRLCASKELFDARCSFDVTSSPREVMLQVVQPQDFEKYFARGNSMFKLVRIILERCIISSANAKFHNGYAAVMCYLKKKGLISTLGY